MSGFSHPVAAAAAIAAAAAVFLAAGAAHATGRERSPWALVPSISLAQDMAWVGGADVCTEKSQLQLDWACFRQSGSQYHGTPVEGAEDNIGAGFSLATARVLFGADVTPFSGISAGVRVGYAFRGGPRPDGGDAFLPVHLELRAAWWPLGPAWQEGKLQPYFLVSGGLAEIDAHGTVTVHEDRSVLPPAAQLDNPDTQTLDVWKKLGRGFASGGIGAYYGFDSTGGVFADVRAMVMFPSSGNAGEIELGYALPL